MLGDGVHAGEQHERRGEELLGGEPRGQPAVPGPSVGRRPAVTGRDDGQEGRRQRHLVEAGARRLPHSTNTRYLDLNQVFTTELAPVWRARNAPKVAADEVVRQTAPLLKHVGGQA